MNSWSAGIYLLGALLLIIMFFGYIYRLSEITACLLPGEKHWKCAWDEAKVWKTATGAEFIKENDLYIHNSMWFIFITMTTVGYGDISPDTNFGRFFSVIACFLGILLTSLITATLNVLLRFSSSEDSGMHVMSREMARINMKEHAADIISLWWRRRRGGRLSRFQMRPDVMHELTTKFHRERNKSNVEVDDLVSMSVKIEKIYNMTRSAELNTTINLKTINHKP
ncbi:hypothetical protein T484DRAFT_2160882 [Baffinella frigidus]|nr:hypothetical protein T484DRAFT_2160882 [Cryptophyta sp. CCMP2293]